MATLTPVLRLTLPPFDEAPWDQEINNDLRIIDGAMGSFFNIANFAGIWKNATAFTAGQTVFDGADSSQWFCNVTHTTPATGTFAQERAAQPTLWTQQAASAQFYAQQSANSASASAASATAAANSAATVAGALPLTGGTMTGLLILSGDPTNVRGAATKQYVDARVGGTGFLPTTGGTLTGPLTLNADPTAALQAATKQYVDNRILRSGDTMTGFLTLNGNPTAVNHAANKQYVDSQIGTRLPIAGGTLNGALTVVGNIVAQNGNILARKDTGNSSVAVWDAAAGVNAAMGFWFRATSQIAFGNVDGGGIPGIEWAAMDATQFVLTFGTGADNFGFITSGGINGHRIVNFAAGSNMDYDNTATTGRGNIVITTPAGSIWNLRTGDKFAFNAVGPVGGIGVVNLSDERFKTNVVTSTGNLAYIQTMRPVEFDWITTGKHDYGFISQEMQTAMPTCVVPMGIVAPDGTGGIDDANPTLGIEYTGITAILVGAVQELAARVTALETP